MILLMFGAIMVVWGRRDPRVWRRRRRPLLGLTGFVGVAVYMLVAAAADDVWALYVAQIAVIGFILAVRGRYSSV